MSGNAGLAVNMMCVYLEKLDREDVVEVIKKAQGGWGITKGGGGDDWIITSGNTGLAVDKLCVYLEKTGQVGCRRGHTESTRWVGNSFGDIIELL